MLDIRKLKELVRLMVANDLTELDLRDSEEQVTLRRHRLNHAPPFDTELPPAAGAGAAAAAAPSPRGVAAAETEASGLTKIASPMVGTFYAAASPDGAPFVTAGSVVEPDTVVCLVEAMKIFNEIKAECSGTVEKVLVNNGDAIEFGQPLFVIKPK